MGKYRGYCLLDGWARCIIGCIGYVGLGGCLYIYLVKGLGCMFVGF